MGNGRLFQHHEGLGTHGQPSGVDVCHSKHEQHLPAVRVHVGDQLPA